MDIKTVLYVEDDALNRTLMKAFLKSLGYEVTLAESGKDTLALLENPNTKIDFILTDLGLPDITGIALAKQIRASQWPAKNVPIIAITGNETNMAKEQAREAGMNGFLNKPVSREMLHKALVEAASGLITIAV